MVFLEVHFQRIIVDVVLLFPATIASIANVTAFVLVSAMSVQLVVPIKALATKATFRMSPEAALIHGTWVVVAELLMFP